MRAAARIVSDLQSRIRVAELERVTSEPGAHGAAVTALIAMGYGAAEANRAVDRVPSDESLENMLREALGFLAEHSRA
jgi:Holliday junction resolvasome RuvABC DNA-binding subunit